MLEAPDEAFDWIHMLTEQDWRLLISRWDDFTAHQREALAYIACEGPSQQSREMLLLALRDKNPDVAVQAAESLSSQREHDGMEFPQLDLESERLIAALADDRSN
jgi:hypothetical protein